MILLCLGLLKIDEDTESRRSASLFSALINAETGEALRRALQLLDEDDSTYETTLNPFVYCAESSLSCGA